MLNSTPAEVRTPPRDATVPNHTLRLDIQGLRALAVSLVVLSHAGVSLLSGGYVGVDVFFVISGFLITSLLLREISATGGISIRRFYARRALRVIGRGHAGTRDGQCPSAVDRRVPGHLPEAREERCPGRGPPRHSLAEERRGRLCGVAFDGPGALRESRASGNPS
jgi:hypothetical protein